MTDKMLLAYVNDTNVHAEFMKAVLDTIVWDLSEPKAQHLTSPGGWAGYYSGPNVSRARNELVKHFLTKSKADWFMSVDTDMVWPPYMPHLLLESAKEINVTVMGSLYWGLGNRDDGGLAVLPMAYEFPNGIESGHAQRVQHLPASPIKVDGTGAGFLLVHRTAMEAVRDLHFSEAFPWFQETEHGGEVVSEDIEFCHRLAVVGHPVYVHPGLEVGHIKEIPLVRSLMMEPFLKAQVIENDSV